MKRQVRWLSAATAVGMFLVMLAGALVTNMDASRGCGHDWPLCNGKFIPAHTLSSLIEYNHRAITGFVGILVVVTTIVVFIDRRRRKDLRWYAAGTLFLTLLQALMGAAAVIWSESSAVLALHFGISLLAVSTSMLLAFAAWNIREPEAAESPVDSRATGQTVRFSAGYRRLVWTCTLYCYAVVYVGAFVRHSNSSGGCLGWPLCNGKVIPELSGATAIVFGHRMAALLLFILVLWLYASTVRNYAGIREVRLASRWAVTLILLQIFSGAWVTFTVGNADQFIFAALFHTVFVTGLFGFLCYLSIRVAKLK